MKKLIFCLFIFCFSLLKSQYGSGKDWLVVGIILCTRIEFTSIDNKAFVSFGPKIPINENHYVSLRSHFNWWDLSGRKFIVIPELDYMYKYASFDKYKDILNHIYVGAGVTPNAVSPKFGLNFYHLFSAEFGYNFEYNTYKFFSTKGFRFSTGINFIF